MSEGLLYGQLTVVGLTCPTGPCNGEPRRRSKISLRKRPVANGVRPGSSRRVITPQVSRAVRSRSTHSVSYTLSRDETVVVEYVPDPTTDMFQIGRSTNSHIDFVVSEPHPHRSRKFLEASVALSSTPNRSHRDGGSPCKDAATPQRLHHESAVSRFACRIHVDRSPPHTARIYAAGFDASNNIFLGELAVKWKVGGQMDGLTTNGVMILRPDGHSSSPLAAKPIISTDSPSQSTWREVSICGSVYEMRNNRSVPTEANRVDEDNVLLDKTLIDLCGVTLLWRSGPGLLESATANDLRLMVDGLNFARFQCPVLYRTLRLPVPDPRLHPSQPGLVTSGDCIDTSVCETKSEPYVYLNCGHVHGWHTWTATGDTNSYARTCPLCLQPSPFVPLRMGLESAFYIDRAFATHCFNPCGHMASEATVRFWCSIRLPTVHSFDLKARCPFCLVSIDPRPVRLRFYGETDTETLIQMLNATLLANACHPSGTLPLFDEPIVSAK